MPTHSERLEEAEAALLESHEILVRAFSPDHRRVHGTVRVLVEVYEASNKPEQAAEWRAKLPTEQETVASDLPSRADDKQDE